ncbi:TPA: hypothetical protein H1062_002873, partial [Listeria monocytogenes]|nr:hypothetical protein [Listeria monocytogenes]
IDFVSDETNYTSEKLTDFICKEKKVSKKEMALIKSIFRDINEFIKTEELNIKVFVNWLVETPKVKKQLIDEEKDWLLKEVSNVKTLKELILKYKAARTLKEE